MLKNDRSGLRRAGLFSPAEPDALALVIETVDARFLAGLEAPPS